MIKVLVATSETQDDYAGDYCYVPDGELVGRYGPVCDRETMHGHGGCGCGRGFGGFRTYKATTSAQVVERSMSGQHWRDVYEAVMRDTGWAAWLTPHELDVNIDEAYEFGVTRIAKLDVGTVVGRKAWNDSCDTTMELLYRRSAGWAEIA